MATLNALKARARLAYASGRTQPNAECLSAADLAAVERSERYRLDGEPGARVLAYDPERHAANPTPTGHRPKGVRTHQQAPGQVAELRRLLHMATKERVLTPIANAIGVSTRTVCRWRDGKHWPESTMTLAAITAARTAMRRH